jgi:L-threonylcarbamoyladenylate synthase
MENELPLETRLQIEQGIDILRKGGVIAFPTDTVYGLGADVFNVEAVERVFAVKKRSRNQALPVLLSDISQINKVAFSMPPLGWRLAHYFFPGALTLVVFRSRSLPDIVTAGEEMVAIRIPAHPVTLALINGLGQPIIGTSANISGTPSLLNAEDVRAQLGDSLDMVIEGGPAPSGIASTVVDVTGEVAVLLREGGISRSELEKAVSPIN